MTTAIERIEADERSIAATLEDLNEVLRLAKLGERVEQCARGPYLDVLVPAQRLTTATGLLSWIKGSES